MSSATTSPPQPPPSTSLCSTRTFHARARSAVQLAANDDDAAARTPSYFHPLQRRCFRSLTAQSLFAKIRKNVPTETIPIVTIVTGAVMGAGYYLYRLSQGSEVVWNRHGDQRPWDKIKQHENIKFVSIMR